MSRRFVSRLPWALLALHVLMTASGFWLEGLNGPEPGEQAASNPVIIVIALIVFAAIGALVASRQTANPVGWLFMGLPLWIGLANLADQYARYAVITRHGSLLGGAAAGWLGSFVWMAGPASLLYALMLFPDGRLPGRRWRATAWGVGTVLFMGAVGIALAPGPLADSAFVDNPIGIEALRGLAKGFDVAGFAVLPVLLLISLASLIVNYRRSEAEAQLRIKWFAYAAFLFASTMSVGIALDRFVPNWVGELMFSVNIILLAAGVGIGILRHRLFDIDVVINKTAVYSGLAAFITAVYVGVVVGIGALVGSGDKPNLGLSLAATAIVAVAFQPVRERVQRFANKLIYGERVTPYEAITGFSHRMAESLSLDSVLPQMAEAAARGIGGVRSRVKLLLPGGGEQVVTWPDESRENSFDRTLVVMHQREEVGEISVSKAPGEQINSSEEKLLTDLASQAGLAMRNLRLTGELQQKLVELQASRQRIVKAQDEERRRMERDIHDGAQQQLVSMSVKLGLVSNLLARDVEKAGALLEELRGEASEAGETLRDLARGLFPEVLTQRGLKSALESHIAKMNLDATVAGEISRFDLEIEANLYFCIREALQNASKHASGASIMVSLAFDDGELSFSVKDEGPGFDPKMVKMGSGLQNMADRVEALGGTLAIEGNPDTGAMVSGRISARELDLAT